MVINTHTLSFISCIINLLSFVVIGIIAYQTLKHTAKPKLKIKLKKKKIRRAYWLISDADTELEFELKNIGHFYAKPAIVNMVLYVNISPEFKAYLLEYGSVLQNTSKEVLRGKENGKYMVARHIKLYNQEATEKIKLKVHSPKKSGNYKCWIAARVNNDDLGVHHFPLNVL